MKWLVGVLIAVTALSASAADPLTLILLRVLRDQLISAAASSAVESALEAEKRRAALAPAQPQPRKLERPFGMDDDQLRRLIDEGFVHLTSTQRDEVFASVKRIIDDPRNAPQVPSIISELALKASAVRQAHEQMSRLSAADKRQIATQARTEFEKLSADEREQMQRALRLRMAPLPDDLNEMILAEFARPLPEAAPGTPAPAPADKPVQPQAPAPAPASAPASEQVRP